MYQQKDDLFSLGMYLFFVFLSFFKQIVVCIYGLEIESHTLYIYYMAVWSSIVYKVLKICMEGRTGEALKPILHLISCHGTFQTVKL